MFSFVHAGFSIDDTIGYLHNAEGNYDELNVEDSVLVVIFTRSLHEHEGGMLNGILPIDSAHANDYVNVDAFMK